MIKQIDENSLSSARIYCQICLVSCEAKYQARRKLEKNSEISNSRVYVEKLKNKNHKYDKTFGFVDWKIVIQNMHTNLATVFLQRFLS